MSRRLLRKKSDSFILAQSFPENIQPTKRLSRKVQKAFLRTRFVLGDLLKKGENSCVQQFLEASSKDREVEISNPKGREIARTETRVSTSEEMKNFGIDSGRRQSFQFLLSLDKIRSRLSKGGGGSRRESEFKLQLREKRKIAFLYGNLTSRELEKAYRRASQSSGRENDNLLLLLERRLDVVLYRLCFYKSIVAARQSITHGGVLINGRILTTASYQVKTGDILSIHPRMEKQVRDSILESWGRRASPSSPEVTPEVTPLASAKLKGVQNLSPLEQQRTSLHSPWRFTIPPALTKGISGERTLPSGDAQSSPLSPVQSAMQSMAQPLATLSESLLKGYRAKKLSVSRNRGLERRTSLIGNPMKPLHLEVSYKSLTAISLFSPQKLTFPVNLNLDLVRKHIQRSQR